MEPAPFKLRVPDPSYRLDAAERARIIPGFDVEALERLLGLARLDLRQEILKHFLIPEKSGEDIGILVEVLDPDLQKVLEEVWAPMWDEVGATDEEINANAYGYPGREIARQRRAARRATRPDRSE